MSTNPEYARLEQAIMNWYQDETSTMTYADYAPDYEPAECEFEGELEF